MSRNPVVINAVERAIEQLGRVNITSKSIQSQMGCYNLQQVPSVCTIGVILRRELRLSKTCFSSQTINYNNPRFDAKRLKITQVVASLLAEGFLVVCIDESSFSTHQWTKKRWRLMDACRMKQQMAEQVRAAEQLFAQPTQQQSPVSRAQ